MDRLKIKCLTASAGFHALLAIVLISNSAFHWRPRVSQSPNTGPGIIELVTLPLEREALTPGSTAAASPPTPATPRPTPGRSPEALNRSAQSKSSSTAKAQRRSQAPGPSTANGDQLLELSHALEGMARRIPAGKAIDLELGSESAGKDDAYSRIVRFFYSQSWEPAGNDDSKAVVKVKITIASDGKVISSWILEVSGDAQMNESVRQTLERVQFIEPFEPGARESERTYTINFSVRATVAAADSAP